MPAPEAPVSLRAWQACLAIAPQRLAHPDFSLSIEHAMAGGAVPVAIRCQVSDLRLEVLDTGLDLICLGLRLHGTLQRGASAVPLHEGRWHITTSFHTLRRGSSCDVVARLDDASCAVDFSAPGLTRTESALVTAALRQWLRGQTGAPSFRLFSFDTAAGQSAGVHFGEFKVSSAFPQHSPGPKSIVLMMRETSAPAAALDLLVDPHVLPEGQTAALWVSRELLARTGGAAWMQAAEDALSLRPRPLGLKIPRITDDVSRWARTIVDHVTIHEGLQFTSMEMHPAGLMLSATPLSLAELDSVSTRDITLSQHNLLLEPAETMFRECVLYYMDDRYREHLLGAAKPALPSEVRSISGEHEEWFRKFGRLQVARAITETPEAGHPPFDHLNRQHIDAELLKMGHSDVYADQTGRLYALAFCVAKPRMSLYVEDAARWMPLYTQHLTSDAYIDHLLATDNPVRQLHDDNAKLTLFDLSGELARRTLPQTLAALMHRLAECRWHLFLKERPEQVQAALHELLVTVGSAPPDTPGAAGGAMPGRPDREALAQALRAAGGAGALSAQFAQALRAEALHPVPAPLDTVIERIARVWQPAAEALMRGLRYLAMSATLVVLLQTARRDALLQAEAVGWASPALALGEVFVSALHPDLDIGQMLKNQLASLVVKGLKLVNKITETSLYDLSRHARQLAESLESVCKLVGVALCVAAAALSIWDAVQALQAGNLGAEIIGFVQAGLAVLGALAIVMPSTGPVSIVLLLAGAILGLVKYLAYRTPTAAEKAALALTQALAADGVAD